MHTISASINAIEYNMYAQILEFILEYNFCVSHIIIIMRVKFGENIKKTILNLLHEIADN